MSKALHCSFCGKRENEVQRLIAGPSAYICDECTYLCALILVEKDVRPQIDAFRTEGSIAEIEAWIANAKPKSKIDSNDLP